MKRTLEEELSDLVFEHMRAARMDCALSAFASKHVEREYISLTRRNLKRYAAFVKRWSKP